MSPKQFRQVLATNYFLLNEEEFRVICKVYASEDGKEVRYVDFLNDTRPFNFDYMTKTKQEFKRGTGTRRVPDNIHGILCYIKRLTRVNGLRFKEYLQDFDPLRKGYIEKNKFLSVITQTMKVDLDEQSINILGAYYTEFPDLK